MLLPLSWLREIIEFDLSPQEVGEVLTMLGLEVEGIIEEGEDAILDVKVTSNRGDCLSLIGIGRELSAKLGLPLNLPSFATEEGESRAEDLASVEIWEEDLCPRYCARIVLGVEVKESPPWLKERLEKAGMRAINNIVDATNYTMLLTGQPLHAFDLDLIRGKKVIVRKARQGEKLITLDGVERTLDEEMLVIADEERAIALAGIMGGLETEVNWGTKNVLIEGAHFNPSSVRRTSRRLGLSTEASYRFERYVDPYLPPLAVSYCARLMKELSGGEVAKGLIDVHPKKVFPRQIMFRWEMVNRLLGTNLDRERIKAILLSLHLDVREEKEGWRVICPTYRADLKEPADLVEEVARIYGYDKIPTTLPLARSTLGGKTRSVAWEDKVREIFLRMGLWEVISHSLLSREEVERLFPGEETLAVRNPLSDEYCYLRPSLIPSLARVAEHNFSHEVEDLAIFEIGKIYRKEGEEKMIGIAVAGKRDRNWQMGKEGRENDFFFLKGIIEGTLEELGLEGEFREGEHPLLEPGHTAEILVDGKSIGFIGKLREEVGEFYDIRKDLYLGELKLEELARRERKYKELPRVPAVERDLSLIVSKDIKAKDIIDLIKRSGGKYLEDVFLFDVYEGKPVPEGKRSLAFSLSFRGEGRTLSSEEVDSLMERIKSALIEELSASIRE